MMRIYIASSYKKNWSAIHELWGALVERGHSVLLVPPKEALEFKEHSDFFTFCTSACGGLADLVIYLGPGGRNAVALVGLAYGAGTPVLGLAGPGEKPEFILNGMIRKWCVDKEELLTEINEIDQWWPYEWRSPLVSMTCGS